MRVLVVEDDEALAGQLRQALEAAGFAVDVEHDGEAASFAGTAEAYSAAVLDLGLPRKDGLSVLRDWREAGCGCPVLVHRTCLRSPRGRAAALAGGMQGAVRS